jgi:hypothetical protein
MTSRKEKIIKLEKFFSGKAVKAKFIVVFKTLINGIHQKPFKNTTEFNEHVQELRTKYEEVLVWEENKTY